MKQFQSHKIVQAARIIAVDTSGTKTQHNPLGLFVFRLDDGTDHLDGREQFSNAKVGGYVVEYKDGYRSYSPAEAFEDGYQELPPAGSQVDPCMALPPQHLPNHVADTMDRAQLAALGNVLDVITPAPTGAPSVPVERIDALVASLTYETAHVPNTTSTVATARLPGGFVVAIGHDACVSAANFKADLGRKYAIESAVLAARAKLWEFEGYALVRRLDLADQLRELIAQQCEPTTLAAGEYMRGMANGMKIALAVVDRKEPVFIPAPPEFTAAQELELDGRPPHQVRVFQEHWALTDKCDKLRAFIETAGQPGSFFDKASDAERVRLRRQLVVMSGYSDILAQRIAAFDKPDVQFRRPDPAAGAPKPAGHNPVG